jgi:ABC-type uncharacterized transport system auxiliary subunit
LAIGGCAGLLTARNAPPPTEYTLTVSPTFPADLPRRDWVLLVAEPVAEGALDTSRIAVLADGRVDRLADVVWSDRATVMLQFLIVQAFQTADRLRAVGTDRDDLPGRYLLQSALNDFQLEPEGNGYAAQVSLHARLIALPTREVAGARELSQRIPATAPSNQAAVTAFDAAVASILAELVPWTLRTGRAR